MDIIKQQLERIAENKTNLLKAIEVPDDPATVDLAFLNEREVKKEVTNIRKIPKKDDIRDLIRSAASGVVKDKFINEYSKPQYDANSSNESSITKYIGEQKVINAIAQSLSDRFLAPKLMKVME